jgi:hypothetical protein
MIRLFAAAALLASTTALATGERVTLVPASNPLKETICVSMNCEPGNTEATVTSRPVRDGLEITVTMASGQRRLTHLVPTKSDGSVSSTDLVRATSLVLRAIEEGPVKGDQPVVTKATKVAKVTKKARPRLLANR